MFEATMEALIGLVARQRGFINHLFGDALAGGRGGPALSAQPAAPSPPAADRTGTDGTGGRVAGRGSPAQLMIFIMGSVGLPLVIAGSGRQLGWLPEQAAPFSAR